MTPNEKWIYPNDETVFNAIKSKQHAIHDSQQKEKMLNLYCYILILLILIFGLMGFIMSPFYVCHVGLCFWTYRGIDKVYKRQKRKTSFWATRLKREKHLLAIMVCPGYRCYYCDFKERIRERML